MPLGTELFGRAFPHRARRGLYAGRRIQFGNRISEDGGNKTRRRWLPNAQNKRIFSDILGYMVPLRVTTGAMRNIDKAGGLDAYVFKIEGTCEDSDKAGKLRTQMGQEQERRRMQQELQAKEQQRRLARLEYDRRATLLPAAAAVIEEQTVHQN